MMTALQAVAALMALVVGAAALIAGVLALATTRRAGLALSVFLDLLLGAGLLRLAGEPDWRAITTAAAIVALRRLLGVGLRVGGRSWTTTPGECGAAHGRSVAVRQLFHPAWRT